MNDKNLDNVQNHRDKFIGFCCLCFAHRTHQYCSRQGLQYSRRNGRLYLSTCGVKPDCSNYFFSAWQERVCKIFFYKRCGSGTRWLCYLADFAKYLWLIVQGCVLKMNLVWASAIIRQISCFLFAGQRGVYRIGDIFLLEPFSSGEGAGRRMKPVRIQVAYRMGERQKTSTSLLKKQYLHKQLLADM